MHCLSGRPAPGTPMLTDFNPSTTGTNDPAAAPAVRKSDREPRGRRQTVLVIDDAIANRTVLEEMLSDQWTVVSACGGAEALELLGHVEPDVVLLDIVMPDVNGFEVLRRMKANPNMADVPVIFITGLDRPEEEAFSLELGAADYITKPFHEPVVRARVAAQMRLSGERRHMEALAHRDALTGIPNRRQFDSVLEHEWRRARRSGQTLSVAMVDVDFFKQYNDHYGHEAGDQALKAVAGALQSAMRRPGDLAARYGGEEFALVMSDTGDSSAIQLAETVRAAVAALQVPHAHSKVAPVLTISLGVATLEPDSGETPELLMRRADGNLYRAKEAGRNRVYAD